MHRNFLLATAVRAALTAAMNTPAAIATTAITLRKQPDAQLTFLSNGGKQKAQWKIERKNRGGA